MSTALLALALALHVPQVRKAFVRAMRLLADNPAGVALLVALAVVTCAAFVTAHTPRIAEP
jgi:hypothetical protein